MRKIVSIFVIVIFGLISLQAKNNSTNQQKKELHKIEKTSNSSSSTRFNINNISTWVFNNGSTDSNPNGNSGMFFPKGEGKSVMFVSGLVWGAKINGEKKVGGSTYIQGLLPGRVIGSGATAVREDETLEHVRIYRVRKNFNDGFASEIADGEGTLEEIKAQYDKDWEEWPAKIGAPYRDVDGNGSYDPSIDIPGVPGAGQTIWYVANDLDIATSQSLYGSNPLGIEMQVTFWGYNAGGILGNTIFRKYKLINKSEDTFDSMYVSIWADPDLGDAGDDFIGCDTLLSLMYTYNGIPNDAVYGYTPPAVGFSLLQGLAISSPGDSAFVDGKYKRDYKNLPVNSYYFIIKGDLVYDDPYLGIQQGTLEFYNLLEGKTSKTGEPFIDPTTSKATKFPLAGDPVTNKGWVDGIIHNPGDRRQGMVVGPFNMAKTDTQEIVVALLASFGKDRLDAVTKLKNSAYYIGNLYNNSSNITKTR